MKNHYDKIIIGAGASGMFYALNSHDNCLILDAGPTPCRKLAISGGGKCNFSNRYISKDNYVCQPEASFCVSALKAFCTDDILRLLKEWRLPFEERENGRLFLKSGAIKFAERLIKSVIEKNCKMEMNCLVKKITLKNGRFLLDASKGNFSADRVIIATGSNARPELACCADCWNLVRNLGHTIYNPEPALTPLDFNSVTIFNQLTGIGVKARASLYKDDNLAGPELTDNLLFTHKGLSGPLILNASLYWKKGCVLELDFLPGQNFENMLDDNEKVTPKNLLSRQLPERLAQALLPENYAARKSAELPRAIRKKMGEMVNRHQFTNLSLAGFSRAEVAKGGVSLAEVNPSTMQSLLLPNLQIIGETLAVTGQLGGYNIHWAFASAFLAAESLP